MTDKPTVTLADLEATANAALKLGATMRPIYPPDPAEFAQAIKDIHEFYACIEIPDAHDEFYRLLRLWWPTILMELAAGMDAPDSLKQLIAEKNVEIDRLRIDYNMTLDMLAECKAQLSAALDTILNHKCGGGPQ
jgi:hypothetical protein